MTSTSEILIIASDPTVGQHVVELITSTKSTPSSDGIITWTISNKYYDADVQFRISGYPLTNSVNVTSAGELEEAPAIIYAFRNGVTDRRAFINHKKVLSLPDAEVCLAVHAPEPVPAATTALVQPEVDEDDLEDFFFKHGFEYVKISSDTSNPSDLSDVPGLWRVRDALSTIMWPTMTRKQPSSGKTKDTTTATRPNLPFLPKQDAETEGVSLRLEDINDDIAKSLFMTPEGAVNEKEMAALEKWLDDDSTVGWKPSSTNNIRNPDFPPPPVPFISITTPVRTPDAKTSTAPKKDGFEDDFAEFVSGVAQIAVTPIDTSAPPNPLHDSTSFEALPSASEVEAATSRIFTNSRPSATSNFERELILGNEDEKEAPEPFDLNQVLGVLNAMKEEISMIEDMSKRRMAAATAALGLVNGLGIDAGGEDDGASDLGELVTAAD